MVVRSAVLKAFAVKEFHQLRRETDALSTFGAALAAVAVFLFLSSDVKRPIVALQCAYMLPSVVVGNLFTRTIEAEVAHLPVLRAMLRDQLEFMAAKFLLMAGTSIVVVTVLGAIVQWAIGLPGWTVFLVRLAILGGAAALQSAICLGLASCFTNLDEPLTTANVSGPVWVHLGYWLSAIPVIGLIWILHFLLTPATQVSDPGPKIATVVLGGSALVLMGGLAALAAGLFAAGARRLSLAD